MKIALDKNSKRHFDTNGFLHVSISNISKECISPYYGYEIPSYKELNLDAKSIYYAYRKGNELEQGAQSFNGLPLLRDHYIEHAENPQKEHRVGSLGTDAVFDSPYLKNSIIVTDAEAIRKIENGERVELSAAYAYTPLFEKGIFEGQEYDFIMTNIRGNHVALVEEGRVGKDVVVADSGSCVAGIRMEEEMVKEEERQDNEKVFDEEGMQDIDDSEDVAENEQEVDDYEDFENEDTSYNSEELKAKFIEKIPYYIQSIKAMNELLKTLMAIDEISDVLKLDDLADDKSIASDKALQQTFKSEIKAELQEVQKAITKCTPLVGELDLFAFDSANAVYLQACKLLDLSANEQSARDVIDAFGHKSNKVIGNENSIENRVFRSRFE